MGRAAVARPVRLAPVSRAARAAMASLVVMMGVEAHAGPALAESPAPLQVNVSRSATPIATARSVAATDVAGHAGHAPRVRHALLEANAWLRARLTALESPAETTVAAGRAVRVSSASSVTMLASVKTNASPTAAVKAAVVLAEWVLVAERVVVL